MQVPKTIEKRLRGPYRKPDALKAALAWCESAFSDPKVSPETKEKIAATVFRFEAAKMARRAAPAVAFGKKDVRAEAAREAAKAAYAPPASPPRLVS